MTELYAMLENVSDRKSFFNFVKALIADREQQIAKERNNSDSPCVPNHWSLD